MTQAPDSCFITGEITYNIPSDVDAIEYSIVYNGNTYIFRFDFSINWKDKYIKENIHILRALLYNNEWPLDKDVFISDRLIKRIIEDKRYNIYPKDFETKAEYLLYFFFKNGAKEFVTFDISSISPLNGFAKTEDELDRIIKYLTTHEYLSIKRGIIEVTLKGIEKGETISNKISRGKKFYFEQESYPSILLCYLETNSDKFLVEKLKEILFKNSFRVIEQSSSLGKDFSFSNNIRNAIFGSDYNYIIYIKSNASDHNASMVEASTFAIERALQLGGENIPFLYVATTDDSEEDSIPRLQHYPTFDIRLMPAREILVKRIAADWNVKLLEAGKENKNRNAVTEIKSSKDLLQWLGNEYRKNPRKNPIDINPIRIMNLISSEAQLGRYIEELENEGYINQERQKGFGDYQYLYVITLLDKFFNSVTIDTIKYDDSLKYDSGISYDQKKYDFPKIELTESEKKWLQIVAENFLNGIFEDFKDLYAKYIDEFPKSFDARRIDRRLLRHGDSITLLGLWNFNPNLDIFYEIDSLIRHVASLIKSKRIKRVDGKDLKIFSHLSEKDLFLRYSLISELGSFHEGLGRKNDLNDPNLEFHFSVDNTNIYEAYLNYQGIEKLMIDFYDSNNPNRDDPYEKGEKKESNDNSIKEVINATIDFSQSPHSFKTPFSLRDRKEIRPVMGVVELSKDLAQIIKTLPDEKGQMVGIFGKWGRGKTFLLNEIWNVLKEDQEINYTKIEYHSWKYQETPASWAYLYELFAAKYLGKPKGRKGIFNYYSKLIDLNAERFGYWPLIKFGLAILIAIIGPIVSIYYLHWATFIVAPILWAACLEYVKKIWNDYSTKAINLVKKYTSRHSFKDTLGIQADIQEELIKLLKVWIPENEISKKKILLVVEDIDRCTEEKVIQSVDALRIMLDDDEICKRVIVISAIDERILKNAVRIKYKSLIKKGALNDGTKLEDANDETSIEIRDLISEYLDKAFIAAIKLGELDNLQRREYLNELFSKEVDENVLKQAKQIREFGATKSDAEMTINEEEMSEIISDSTSQQFRQAALKQEKLMSQTGREYDLAIRDGDFVVKDGDYALKDSRGNIVSNLEIENTIRERIVSQNKFEKLTPYEINVIEDIVEKWTNSTPRKIRIFYYRYLLCKNLIISKYSALANRVNIWQDEKGIKILMHLILEYTLLHKPESITDKKIEMLASGEERTIVAHNKQSDIIYRIDYLYLLEVLELVIAY